MEENTIWMRIISILRIGQSRDQRVVLAFGLSKLTYILVNTILIYVAGLLIGDTLNCLSYFLVFFFLRTYAGGYHAHSKTTCFIVTCIIEVCAIFAIYLIRFNVFSLIACMVLSILIYMLAPIESVNKPLTKEEQHLYKNKTAFAVLLCVIIVFLDNYTGYDCICVGIYVALIEVFLMMLPNYVTRFNNS